MRRPTVVTNSYFTLAAIVSVEECVPKVQETLATQSTAHRAGDVLAVVESCTTRIRVVNEINK